MAVYPTSRCCSSSEQLNGDFRRESSRLFAAEAACCEASRCLRCDLEKLRSCRSGTPVAMKSGGFTDPRWTGSHRAGEADHPRGAPASRRAHSPSLPRSRLAPTGRLPAVPGRDRGRGGLAHLLHAARPRPAWSCAPTPTTIRASRKTTLELLLSEHRVACTTCDADGDCLLQDYAYEYQAAETRFPSVATPPGAAELHDRQQGHRLRPVQVRPLPALRADLRRGRDGRGAHAARARRPDVQVSTGFDVAAERVHLRALRPVRRAPARPARCASARRTGLGPRQGPREGPHDLHLLRRRLPDGPERQPATQPHRARHERAGLRAQRRQPLRQGHVRLRVRPFAGAADASR